MSDILRVEHHLRGFGIVAVTPAHLHLNSEKPTQTQPPPSGKPWRRLVNNSLVCQANKETHSTVKHQSQKRPGAGAHPWRKGCCRCWWWRWGRRRKPVYSFCHSLEHPRCRNSPKETSKHILRQATWSHAVRAHMCGALKCRLYSTQPIQAHVPELNQGPATSGLGRWEDIRSLFSE